MTQEYTRAPHRRPFEDAPQHSAALLIDFDNVTMGVRSNLGQEFRDFLESDIIRGKVAVQRAYADWRRYPQYIVSLSEASIDLIFAPAYGSSKKNATDIRLAIDALELVFTRPEIGTFILLSGDSDFSSLVLKLKEYGKYVIGVGLQESTSDILVQNCDEYYSYNRLSGLTSADEIVTEKHDPWELTGKAVARMAARGDVMRSDRLKQVMLEMDSSFDEKTAGYTKFNRFLGEAAQRDLIHLRKGENGQYEVSPIEGGERPEVPTPPATSNERSSSVTSRSHRSRRGGRSTDKRGQLSEPPSTQTAKGPATQAGADALKDAYAALVQVVDGLYKNGKPVRDSMAKRKLLARDATFDEAPLGFSKFSLFLRQADKDGIVIVRQGENGNYYLSPSEGSPSPTPGAAIKSTGSGKDSQKKTEPRKENSRLSAATAAARRTLGRFRKDSASELPREDKTRSASQRSEKQASRTGTGGASRNKLTSGHREVRKTTASRPTNRRSSTRPGDRSEANIRKDREPTKKTEERRTQRDSTSTRSRVGHEKSASRIEPRGERKESAVVPSSEPSPKSTPEPRRLGRYRQGSRGRVTPTKSSGAARSRIGPIPDDELPSRGGSAQSTRHGKHGTTSPDDVREKNEKSGPGVNVQSSTGETGPTSHMIRNYAGVGKRTAEVLFERFGESVFDVIDSNPDRLAEVLSEGRAKVVVEARRIEREG
jgi:uncharacterized protein (TIGR00288 family)